MISRSKNIGALIMLMVLFSATSGISLYSHFCSSSGFSQVSVKQLESCCSGESESGEAQLESSCCSTDHQTLKIESVFTNQEANSEFLSFGTAEFFTIWDFNQPSVESHISAKANSPPLIPRNGRTLLTEFNILLI